MNISTSHPIRRHTRGARPRPFVDAVGTLNSRQNFRFGGKKIIDCSCCSMLPIQIQANQHHEGATTSGNTLLGGSIVLRTVHPSSVFRTSSSLPTSYRPLRRASSIFESPCVDPSPVSGERRQRRASSPSSPIPPNPIDLARRTDAPRVRRRRLQGGTDEPGRHLGGTEGMQNRFQSHANDSRMRRRDPSVQSRRQALGGVRDGQWGQH